jgi:hypothetical protein
MTAQPAGLAPRCERGIRRQGAPAMLLNTTSMPDPRVRPPALRLPLGPRVASPLARAAGLLAGIVVLGAVVVALMPWTPWVRAAVGVVLVGLSGGLHHALSRRRRPPAGWLVVDHQGVKRPGQPPLVGWSMPFGVTVLASADRSRLVLALTSADATRFLAVRVLDAGDAAEAPSLFDRAVTAADGDLRGDEGAALCAADAERLLSALARRSPGALDRLYLSDASGEAVVLDRGELRVGTRRIDLSAPLEWRAFVFQELGAHAASVCQATWVRQGEGEVVLVSPLGEGAVSMQGAPDARLIHAVTGDPPPRELRRAIDRLFMLPLRRALDRAPRVSRAPSSPVIMPEGRA